MTTRVFRVLSLLGTAVSPIIMMMFMTSCVRGCSTPSAPSLARQQGVLRVQLSADPVTVDPSLAEDGLSMGILHNVMDGLVGYDAEGKLVSRLAEAWTISKDGLRYEFTIRPKAFWSDGIVVQPLDFITGFKRALSPRTDAKLAPLLFAIRGARAYHLGPGKPGGSSELPGVYEKNGKLVIELEAPTPYFLDSLTLANAAALRKDILDDNGQAWPIVAPSTGAYRIVAYQTGRRFLLDQNENYWGKPPALKIVDMLIVQDDGTGVNLFEKGDLDILTRVPSADLPRLRAKGVIQEDPFLATFYLGFNTRKPPFNDPELRRAVSGVIHRDELVKALGSGEKPSRSWIPPGLEGFMPYTDPTPVFASAVAKVRQILVNGALKLPPVLAGFDSSARNSTIMEKVQADVKAGLGLNLLLSNMDWKSYLGSLRTDPSMIYRLGWLAPFRDPISHLEVFTSGNMNNYTGWSDGEYDRLVGEISHLAPGPARDEKILHAQKILVDDQAVIVPLYHYAQQHAVSPRLQGVRANPYGTIDFSQVSLRAAH